MAPVFAEVERALASGELAQVARGLLRNLREDEQSSPSTALISPEVATRRRAARGVLRQSTRWR